VSSNYIKTFLRHSQFWNGCLGVQDNQKNVSSYVITLTNFNLTRSLFGLTKFSYGNYFQIFYSQVFYVRLYYFKVSFVSWMKTNSLNNPIFGDHRTRWKPFVKFSRVLRWENTQTLTLGSQSYIQVAKSRLCVMIFILISDNTSWFIEKR
jgi:hypothetical protein